MAIQRGPLLYCAEGVDNQGHATDLSINIKKSFKANFQPDLLNGVTVLTGKGSIISDNKSKKVPIQLIPYYAWSHRDISPMAVWLGE